MADSVKHVKYGELEQHFFGNCEDIVNSAKGHIPPCPDKGISAGRTFMQAYFGHSSAANALCLSMEDLFKNTRQKIMDAGVAFKDIDEKIARSVEQEV